MLNDNLKTFNRVLAKLGIPKPLLHALKEEDLLRHLLHELGLFKSGDYLGDLIIDILPRFANEYAGDIEKYMRAELHLYAVCQRLIKYIYNKKISLNLEKVKYCLRYNDSAVNETVKKRLENRGFQRHLNIIGYGLGDASFENEILHFLLDLNKANTIKLYGFDPHRKTGMPNVEMISESRLLSPNCPTFDIVIARWVLHHIHFNERWSNFGRCVNCCEINADIIIIEEGCFPKNDIRNIDVLNYELLHALVDVIINAHFHKNWLFKNQQCIGEDFFIQYLSCLDINELQNSFEVSTKRSVISIDSGFPYESLIQYNVVRK